MDLSSQHSRDEDKVMQRQLYRAGQNQPAQASASPASRPKTTAAAKPKPKSGSSGQSSNGQRILLMILLLGVGYYLLHGTPSQRRKVYIGLGVAAWLLLLGGISYCLSLPDLEGMNHERMAIWQDKNLSFEEKREKMEQLREREKNLTPAQRKQMGEMDRKERTRKRNKDSFEFLKLSPEEQVAQLKREAAEREKWFQQMRKMRADKGGGQKGNRGGGGPNGGKGGGNGGPGGGRPGGGGGGGGANADRPEAIGQRLDTSSPESRAGGLNKMMMMQQLGLGFGGRGGPGGGGPGGGKGGGGR
jgi:uncharacterized membrane protein YgcG